MQSITFNVECLKHLSYKYVYSNCVCACVFMCSGLHMSVFEGDVIQGHFERQLDLDCINIPVQRMQAIQGLTETCLQDTMP